MSFLVIGYGNTLRNDDGLGPAVADKVEAWNLPHVEAMAVHQLTPEMSDPISHADKVVFVDASVRPVEDGILIEEIRPDLGTSPTTHAGGPEKILGLAQYVFGHCPEAWMISIPGPDMDFGETFSPAAQKGMVEALEKIKEMMNAE